jgi:hydroxypyruvate isomerase
MFSEHAGDDPVAQLEFAAEVGFTAWEDNGMMGRPVEEQRRIAEAMDRLGIEMGVFVAYADFGEVSFARQDEDVWDEVLAQIRASVEVAQRVNATWMTVVPGRFDPKLAHGFQMANTVKLLRRCADILEPHDLTMVLEPLNHHTDHPGVFLTGSDQAYQLCEAVDSPSCKILFDIYHQQITEGNLIPNIEQAWDHIGYFQMGDNPGRNEPTTGEINFRNIFAYIHERGYDGILGMEHGNSQPGEQGEQAVIDAYVYSDDFASS